MTSEEPARVFVSYTHADSARVVDIVQVLEELGIPTWVDVGNLKPGLRWKAQIRDAIIQSPAAILCLSSAYIAKDRTYVNEELTLMIEELRQRRVDRVWLLVVRLDECVVPDRLIGAGESLRDLQYIDLFPDVEASLGELVAALSSVLEE